MAAPPPDGPGNCIDGGAAAGRRGGEPGAGVPAASHPGSVLRDEFPAVVLLVVLYMLQGVPLGLSMGSM